MKSFEFDVYTEAGQFVTPSSRRIDLLQRILPSTPPGMYRIIPTGILKIHDREAAAEAAQPPWLRDTALQQLGTRALYTEMFVGGSAGVRRTADHYGDIIGARVLDHVGEYTKEDSVPVEQVTDVPATTTEPALAEVAQLHRAA